MEQNSTQLFSVIIVSYNNYKYIYDAIDSVLEQDYPNIEIVISNDGSKDFLEDEVKSYIETNKKDNIKNLVINNNEVNIGTVKNVNKGIGLSKGEFIFLMAADDGFYDATVVSKYVEYFNKLKGVAHVITAQTAMCGESLSSVEYFALDDTLIDIIKKYKPHDMFKHLAHTYTIPATSTCYRRSFYDIVGMYDEDYYLIEDAPQFIRMSRLGVRAYYLDIIAARHRDGGISHGNKSNTSEAFARYLKDEILFYEKEVFPYADIIGKDRIRYVKEKHYLVSKSYIYRFEYKNYSFLQKVNFVLRSLKYVSKKTIRPTIDKIVQFSFNAGKMKNCLSFVLMTLGVYLLLDYVKFDMKYGYIITDIYRYIANISVIAYVFLILVNISYTLYRMVKNMLKAVFVNN